MERNRGPAEAPNLGEPSIPRPAASVVLLRRGGKHGDRALEVLMLKRAETPDCWSTYLLFRATIDICSTISRMNRGTSTG